MTKLECGQCDYTTTDHLALQVHQNLTGHSLPHTLHSEEFKSDRPAWAGTPYESFAIVPPGSALGFACEATDADDLLISCRVLTDLNTQPKIITDPPEAVQFTSRILYPDGRVEIEWKFPPTKQVEIHLSFGDVLYAVEFRHFSGDLAGMNWLEFSNGRQS